MSKEEDREDYYGMGRDDALNIVQGEIDRLGFSLNEGALRDSLERIREEIRNLRYDA